MRGSGVARIYTEGVVWLPGRGRERELCPFRPKMFLDPFLCVWDHVGTVLSNRVRTGPRPVCPQV